MSTDTSDNIGRGIGLAIAAMIIFASHDALIKIVTEDYSAPQILWVRFMLFFVFALILATRKRPLRDCFKSRRPILQVFRSGALVLDMGLFVVAVGLLPLADTHALVATFPLMVTALAALFLGEQVGLRRWLAVGACFLGVLIILRPGLSVFQPGAVYALATAFCFSVYVVLTRVVSRDDSSETSLLYVASLGLGVTSLIGPFFWKEPTLEAWGLFVLISGAGTLAHFLLINALNLAPASVLQPFNYVLLLWATVLGLVVFGQFPDAWTLLGSATIVASGLYVIYRERRRGEPAGRTAR